MANYELYPEGIGWRAPVAWEGGGPSAKKVIDQLEKKPGYFYDDYISALVVKQKQNADDVLEVLGRLSNSFILAGGAPRDWYFDKVATDLDFFVQVPDDVDGDYYAAKMLADLKKDLGFEDYKMLGEGKYENIDGAFCVGEFEYKGSVCQIIFTHHNPKYVVDNFPFSISKAWYDGECHYHDDFHLTVSVKCILGDQWGGPYAEKILGKFRDFKLEMSKEALLRKLGENEHLRL